MQSISKRGLGSPASKRYLFQNGSVYDFGDTESDGLHKMRSRHTDDEAFGANTPGYWKKKKRGDLLPMNLYRCLRGEATTSASFSASHKAWGNCYWYWSNGPALHRSEWRVGEEDFAYYYADGNLQKDLAYALQAAASRIYASGFDMLTFMGEFRETVQFFNGLTHRYANRLTDTLKNTNQLFANKATPKTLDQLQKALSDTYLEGRYAFRPLAYDLQDFAKAIARLNDRRVRFRESVRASNLTRTTTGTLYENWTAYSQNYHTWTKESFFSSKAIVAADIEPPQFALNPLVSGWELTTLSFVVDWFVNVGQYLESLSFLALARSWYGAHAYVIEVRSSMRTTSVIPYTSQVNSVDLNYIADAHYKLVSRSPANSLPYLPQVKVRLDEFKVADMLALLCQRFKILKPSNALFTTK